jgi:hypothetical protein
MTRLSLNLRPEAVRSGHDEAEISDLRQIDSRIIDFIDDAEADREPQPRRTESAANHVLGAARPSRRDAGRSGCMTLWGD